MSGKDDEEDFLRQMEERVRKVWHLDPIRFWVREDGRFSCELNKPIDELTAEEAERLLDALEPIMRRLEKRAGTGSTD